MRRLGDHAALVVSLTALVIALGGTAAAAGYVVTSSSQIKDGAVASADVRNSSLTGADIKDGAVASADVRNSSLTGADIKDGSLDPTDFTGSVAGPKGDTGPQGPAGPKGETGATGPSDTYTGFSASGSLPSSPSATNHVAMALTIDGLYLVQANVILTNTGSTAVLIECRLSAYGVDLDFAATTLDAAGGLDTQTLTLAGTGPSGTAAHLWCSGPVDYVDADVIATRVGTLH